MLNLGFAAEEPTVEAARDGRYAEASLGPDSPVIGVWTEIFGGQQGDRLSLGLTGPDGRRLHETGGTVPRPLAVLFIGAKLPRPPGSWPAGTYRVTLSLLRGDRQILNEERSIDLR